MMQTRYGRILASVLSACGAFWLMAAPPMPGEQGLPQPKKQMPSTPAPAKGAASHVEKKAEPPAGTAEAARFYLDGMVRAMGGAEKLATLKTLRLEWIASFNLREQSERPEGPYLLRLMQATEERDVQKGRFRITLQSRSYLEPRWTDAILIGNPNALAAIGGEQQVPANPHVWLDFREPTLFAPERLATTAREGKDLKAEPEITYAGMPHVPVTFVTAGGLPARILFSKDTMLPSAVEWTSTRPSDPQWYAWGDIKSVVRYSVWAQDIGGIRYPRQWDVERGGQPYSSVSVTSLAFNPVLDEASLTVDPTVERIFAANAAMSLDNVELGVPNNPAMPLDQRTIFIPGRLSVTLIRQDDGVVVLDAPISNAYSRKVMEEAGWRFRGQPVKAVVATTDGWLPNGGLREYVASSIPVYLPAINRPFLESLLASPHVLRPDSLASRPKPAVMQLVSQRTALGSGPGRIELIPMKTSAGERAMLVYLPEIKHLYTSTMVTQLPDKSFVMPSYLGEVISVVQREKLDVTAVFGAMLRPTPYSEMVQFYNRVADAPLPEAK